MSCFTLLSRGIRVLAIAAALPLCAATITVTNTNDSGPGSLRDALIQAQAGTYDRVAFSIGTGPQTIQPLSNLPGGSRLIVIDGATQPGYSGQPLIEIDGSLVSGTVFQTFGLGVAGVVRALVINNFIGPAILPQSPYLEIRGCYLGTDRTGTVAKPNGYGVRVLYGAATVGGADPADGNLIVATHAGVEVFATSDAVTIQGTRSAATSRSASRSPTARSLT